MQIGQKIRNAREDLNLSQSKVSSMIPMNQSSYSKIERDVQEPSIEQLRRICQILNISADYLLALDKYDGVSENDIRFSKDVKNLYKKYYGK